MKKLFTICVFAFAFLLNTQIGFAQVKIADPANDEKLAALVEEAKSMASDLGLSDDQMNAFTRAYVAREKELQSTDTNTTVKQTEKKVYNDKKFIAKMTETLNDDQLEKFKEIYKKKMQKRN